MFHLLANYINIGTTVDTDVTPVTDGIFLIQNSHFVPQQDIYLLAAYAGEATPSRVRLVTPSLRVISTPWIRPINAAVTPADKLKVADYRDTPLRLRALEEIQVWATSALTMGNEHFFSGLWVGDGIQPAPSGDIITMRGTSTTAAVAQTWTQLSMSWQDTLPNGTYAIVGLVHESANAVFCRLIVNGQQYRPGTPSITSLSNRGDDIFVKSNFGVFGQFKSVAMPIPEVLVNGTDNAHEVYLEFIRIA